VQQPENIKVITSVIQNNQKQKVDDN